jgi:hypothetical protein
MRPQQRNIVPGALIAILVSIVPGRASAQCQIAKLVGADGARDDRFGFSVGIAVGVVMVGTPWHDEGPDRQGSVYLFEQEQGEWLAGGKLPPPGSNIGPGFGRSIALEGDRALFGVMPDLAAYVFDGSGRTWHQTARLRAREGWFGDFFAWSVALSADVAVVGAPRDSAAYVFERRPAGEWLQTARLVPTLTPGGRFGDSVAIDGDVIVIGAPDAGPLGNWSGVAHVFERVGGAWTQTNELIPSDGGPMQAFGTSVAVSSDTALIGASNAHGREPFSGAAYVFLRDAAGTWLEVAKLTAQDGDSSDGFGGAVVIGGDRGLIGAIGDDDRGWGAGAAYIFERDSAQTWSQTAKLLADDGGRDDRLGWAVALDGDYAVMGAPFDDDMGLDAGSAYVFSLNADLCECLAADLDGDGVVALGDLGILLADFGCAGGTPTLPCPGDIDNDGDTDLADLGILLANFGTTCP